MQELSSRQEVMAQAVQELSDIEIEGIKVLHCQLHGVDYRKKLVSRDLIYFDFPLMRVLITYQYGKSKKRSIIVQSRLVYPNNVYPYGRKTLEVLEDIAEKRYKDRVSWKILGDIFYDRYDFSLENLKRAIIRVNVAFNRLLTVGLIQALNIIEWRFGERESERERERERESRSFITLSFAYREKLFSGIRIFGAKLAISDFDLFRK